MAEATPKPWSHAPPVESHEVTAALSSNVISPPQRVLLTVCLEFDGVGKELRTVDLLRAADAMLGLYDLMFPSGGQVPTLLKNDHLNHIKQVRAAMEKAAEHETALARDFVRSSLRTHGRDKARKDWGTGVLGLLWIARTFGFIGRFLALVEDPATQPYKAARDAYGEVLRPYHTLVVSMVVRVALGLVGSRDNLRANFGMPTDEATTLYMARTGQSMRRVFEELMVLLNEEDVNFPDAVGIMG